MSDLTIKSIVDRIINKEIYTSCWELSQQMMGEEPDLVQELDVQVNSYDWLQENGYKFQQSENGWQWDYNHPKNNFEDAYYFDTFDECIDNLLYQEQPEIPYHEVLSYWIVSDWFAEHIDGCVQYLGLNIWAQVYSSIEDDDRILAYAEDFARQYPSLMEA